MRKYIIVWTIGSRQTDELLDALMICKELSNRFGVCRLYEYDDMFAEIRLNSIFADGKKLNMEEVKNLQIW